MTEKNLQSDSMSIHLRAGTLKSTLMREDPMYYKASMKILTHQDLQKLSDARTNFKCIKSNIDESKNGGVTYRMHRD
jgi:hypothetical protein